MLPTRKINLDEEDEKVEDSRFLSQEDMKSFQHDINKISSSTRTKNVIVKLESERIKSKFVTRMGSILQKFDKIKIDDDDKLQTLFIFVMQSANDILENDEEAYRLCLELLKQFVNNDEALCKGIMNIVKSKIKPLTFFRKYKHQMYRWATIFFQCLREPVRIYHLSPRYEGAISIDFNIMTRCIHYISV